MPAGAKLICVPNDIENLAHLFARRPVRPLPGAGGADGGAGRWRGAAGRFAQLRRAAPPIPSIHHDDHDGDQFVLTSAVLRSSRLGLPSNRERAGGGGALNGASSSCFSRQTSRGVGRRQSPVARRRRAEPLATKARQSVARGAQLATRSDCVSSARCTSRRVPAGPLGHKGRPRNRWGGRPLRELAGRRAGAAQWSRHANTRAAA